MTMAASAAPLVYVARSCVAYVFAACYMLVFYAPALALTRLLRTRSPLMSVGLAGIAATLRLAGIRYGFEGGQHVRRQRGCVYCINHASALDVVTFLVLQPLCPRLVILYKAELHASWLIGPAFDAAGFIPIDRSSLEHARRAIDTAVEALRQGASILVSPEGTRSRDGRRGSFKKGVFVMAINAGAPIVPVGVVGAADALPKGSFIIRSRRLWVRIGAPVETQGCTYEDRDRVGADVAHRIEQLLSSRH
jgi:1-acyl-sn-glycerol-3-phosphate acyltransferase